MDTSFFTLNESRDLAFAVSHHAGLPLGAPGWLRIMPRIAQKSDNR
jgi:hypothetical protein